MLIHSALAVLLSCQAALTLPVPSTMAYAPSTHSMESAQSAAPSAAARALPTNLFADATSPLVSVGTLGAGAPGYNPGVMGPLWPAARSLVPEAS